MRGAHAPRSHRAQPFSRGHANLFVAPAWLLGLYGFTKNRRYRMRAWMYLVPVALLLLVRGCFHICGRRPTDAAVLGSMQGERWLRGRRSAVCARTTALMSAGVIAIGG